MLEIFLREDIEELDYVKIAKRILGELKTGYANKIYFPYDYKREREEIERKLCCLMEIRDMFHTFRVEYILNEKTGQKDRLVIYADPCLIIEEETI